MSRYLLSPLDLICCDISIFFEDIIDLFSLLGSPKISFPIREGTSIFVYLSDDKIFPNIPDV